MAITLTHQLLVKWECHAKQSSLLHWRLAVIVVPWIRDSRLWPEQLLADRLQLLFSRQAGFQGGFDVALLPGRSHYVQVAIHIVDQAMDRLDRVTHRSPAYTVLSVQNRSLCNLAQVMGPSFP